MPPQPRAPDGRPFVLAALLLLTAALALAVSARRNTSMPGLFDVIAFNAMLVSSAAVLGAVFGVLCLLRWRLVGETASLWVGTATLLFSTASMLGGDVLAALVSSAAAAEALAAAGLAGLVTTVWLLAAAVRCPPLGIRVRPGRVVAATVAVAAAIAAGAPGWPPRPPAQLGMLTAPLTAEDVAVRLAAACGCAALAAVYTVIGLRQARWMLTWFGLGLFSVAFGYCFSAMAENGGDLRLSGAAGFHLLGMLLAINGGGQDLRRAWAERERHLHTARVQLELREAQRQAERAQNEERAHDARSVITAVHGAVAALEEGHDRLDAQAREALAKALRDELRRLQRLVEPAGKDEVVEPLDVASVLDPIIRCRHSGGADIRSEVPPGLIALGRPHDLAEVVQNLLDNARHHASDSPVTVRAGTELANVVVRVMDRGPGVDPAEREAIFERGRRGSTGSPGGSGLGLYVSRRLMRRQGGDLWVEGRPGGGASFVLYLPGFSVAGLPPQVADPTPARSDSSPAVRPPEHV